MSVLSCTRAIGSYHSMPTPGIDSEFQEHWTVVTDNVNDTSATIYATGCLPARYTPHPENFIATVRMVDLNRETHAPTIWRATVFFSSVPLSQEEEEQTSVIDPVYRKAEIEWVSTAYDTPASFAFRGRPTTTDEDDTDEIMPIINSAGDVPDQVVVKTDYHWVVHVQKNVLTVPNYALDFAGKVNSKGFVLDGLPILPECARMIDYRVSKLMKEGPYPYRVLTMGIELRPKRRSFYTEWPPNDTNDTYSIIVPSGGWPTRYPRAYNPNHHAPPPFYVELADIGLREFNPTRLDGRKRRIREDEAPRDVVSHAVPLNGQGIKTTTEEAGTLAALAYRTYDRKDFNLLPLD